MFVFCSFVQIQFWPFTQWLGTFLTCWSLNCLSFPFPCGFSPLEARFSVLSRELSPSLHMTVSSSFSPRIVDFTLVCEPLLCNILVLSLISPWTPPVVGSSLLLQAALVESVAEERGATVSFSGTIPVHLLTAIHMWIEKSYKSKIHISFWRRDTEKECKILINLFMLIVELCSILGLNKIFLLIAPFKNVATQNFKNSYVALIVFLLENAGLDDFLRPFRGSPHPVLSLNSSHSNTSPYWAPAPGQADGDRAAEASILLEGGSD